MEVKEGEGIWFVYSFGQPDRIVETLEEAGFRVADIRVVPMTLEDAFIGYTGKY